MTYRPHCEKPCRECPFKRTSLEGWLGAAPPESFIREINIEHPLPCHLTIDYDDPKWHTRWLLGRVGSICSGSLIFMSNTGKLPRDPKFPSLPADHKLVFSSPKEFIDHHRSTGARSWED